MIFKTYTEILKSDKLTFLAEFAFLVLLLLKIKTLLIILKPTDHHIPLLIQNLSDHQYKNIGDVRVQFGGDVLMKHFMSFTEFRCQVKSFIILGYFVLFGLVVENHCKISFGSYDYGDVVVVVFAYLFVVLFELKDRIGVVQVVDIEYAIEMFESSLLDVLKHFESTRVPLYECTSTIVRLTTNWRLIFIFLNLSWNATVGSISSLNFYF